ncbi:hypothetical protein KM885_10975 [Oceanobacillus caeni]|uniref:hypothetical protein n=1 Tax=Oceanobacillus caeni TaxID=405946 RepID=UPI001C214749|nr:hypothetical protein [Oceanobacillus caeni]MBU8791307.1 hypothetical protein [Oceanobacillus caeni]
MVVHSINLQTDQLFSFVDMEKIECVVIHRETVRQFHNEIIGLRQLEVDKTIWVEFAKKYQALRVSR